MILAALMGCQTSPPVQFGSREFATTRPLTISSAPEYTTVAEGEVRTVNFESTMVAAPPRLREINDLSPWPMSLDDAIQIALNSSSVVRGNGGRVLAFPDSIRSSLDPAIARTDASFGPEAALSAFDIQSETGLFWNGGGRLVGPGFSSGPFGVFSHPTTMAKLGLAKTLTTGTEVGVGGIGGYDPDLAEGGYAALGARVRHPLLRGAGSEFNRIAGPYAKPGTYRGIWIAQIDTDKAHLELERAVHNLVNDVASTYWELYFAFQNLDSKRTALQHARRSRQHEQRRVAEQVSPADFEAMARQQFYTAEAAVQCAICGTGTGSPGVYGAEVKLRMLLGIPISDGKLIRPITRPLEAGFRFDWNESLATAQSRRPVIRKQIAELQKRELELKVAKNLRQPQVDLVGQYRRLADDPGDGSALFAEALQGWQIGVEVRRALGNRREKAAVHNAHLRLSRAQALLDEQRKQITGQLRVAFTELDRAYNVTQSVAAGRDAARERLQAEADRHAAGDTHIERVLQAQTRAAAADTAYLRSLLDYNLAFIGIHAARGTLLDVFGVGFSECATANEIRFSRNVPSAFATGNPKDVLVAEPRIRHDNVPAETLHR